MLRDLGYKSLAGDGPSMSYCMFQGFSGLDILFAMGLCASVISPMGVLFNNILKHRSLFCAQNLMESSSLLRLVPALHTGPAG